MYAQKCSLKFEISVQSLFYYCYLVVIRRRLEFFVKELLLETNCREFFITRTLVRPG